MRRYEREGVCWLEFELLQGQRGLRHAIFLRQGGVSQGPYAGLNVNEWVGDDRKAVEANHQRVCKQIGGERLVYCRQEHGVQIAMVDTVRDLSQVGADALVTDCTGQILMTQCADCQCALFYDPQRRIIANVHAGWRGSVRNIYAQVVTHLQQQYGCQAKDLLVGIGPSLGPDKAEFINYVQELPKAFWRYQVRPHYFDFWSISRGQLQESGVLPHHIEIASLCTYSSPEDYFSYRRDKVTGRHGVVIALS